MALDLIAARSKPMKPLTPAMERWKMHFEEIDDRYKMLVLYGPSRTGKSRLARSFFGTAKTFVVDIQHAEHPDLRHFRRGEHRAILLDEMSSPEFIVGNKVLQAHVDGAILGQSATQMYTYEVFLRRIPIAVTTKNWDYSHLSGADQDWIRQNCVEVLIDTLVWQQPGSAPSPESPARQPQHSSDVPGVPQSPVPCRKRPVASRSLQATPEHKHAGVCCGACGQRLPSVMHGGDM